MQGKVAGAGAGAGEVEPKNFILPKFPCFINQIDLNFLGNRYNAGSFVKNNANWRCHLRENTNHLKCSHHEITRHGDPSLSNHYRL